MKRTVKLALFILICLITKIIQAQYTIVSCEEYGFENYMVNEDGDASTGTNGKEFDLFSLYKTPGLTIPDCVVYKHENNLDFVIVPNDWLNSPERYVDIAIDALFEAMVKSRIKFDEFGEVTQPWYFMFGGNAPDRHAWTYPTAKECWMRSIKWLDDKESLKDFKQTIAHEAGHCFSLENLRGPEFIYRQWLEESNAEYMSTMVYPTNNQEHEFALEFDMDNASFRQVYFAYLLLEYYANLYSNSAAMDLVKEMIKRGTPLLSKLRRLNYDQILHETYFTHYQGELPDSGGGLVPRESSVEPRGRVINLTPGTNQFSLPSIPSERLSVFKLNLPKGFDLVLHPPVENSEKAYFSIIAGSQEILEWNSQLEIEGRCEDKFSIDLLSSHLNGSAVTGTKVKYELTKKPDCCAPSASVGPNPDENRLNGQFDFDYYISSTMSYMADGETQTFPLNYYVNSKDGSMMFTQSWFTTMFETTESGGMEIDALIMLANGQLVGYVNDLAHMKKRAITIDMNQTRGDIMRVRNLNSAELFRNGRRASVSPAPLPVNSTWTNASTAYAYYQPEKSNPAERNLLTAYVSNKTSSARSPMSQFGFMVGHIKDNEGRSRNLVFTQFVRPKGDWFKAHLDFMERRCASFTSEGYEKMTLRGSTGAVGAMSESERNELVASQEVYFARLGALIQKLAACGDDKSCEEQVNKEILYLEKERQNQLINLREDPNASGVEGVNFQLNEKQISDRLFAKHEQIIEQERRCASLNDQNVGCGGCMDSFLDRCYEQLNTLKEELNQLNCEMAKLHGTVDMMEDCH